MKKTILSMFFALLLPAAVLSQNTAKASVNNNTIEFNDKGVTVNGNFIPYSELPASVSSSSRSVSWSRNGKESNLIVNGKVLRFVKDGVEIDGRFVPYKIGTKAGKLSSYGTDINLSDINSGMDFLQRFGNLRASYLASVRNQDDIELQTALANKIIALCKSYRSGLLSTNEATIVRNELKELKSKSPDKYIASLFDAGSRLIKN